ncbi:RNA methylase [Marinicauda salina]|uniref:RNA methylase n=1 Tax=Marinicauda salina TaxID=2135793 RepID=A0A2U2BVQ4_9PROT|nr:DNA methyltransferase [Marinicauda salina]PWE18082.1 RNA methylase [Marinicauda salina]
MKINWGKYKHFPYEKRFAIDELRSIVEPEKIVEDEQSVLIEGGRTERCHDLTYFSEFGTGNQFQPTRQHLIEISAGNGGKRQSTRYSVHGLHEYKGKFNPQVARALLNILAPEPGATILDPFCGSGTTLIEAVHLGHIGYGIDVNPLAIYITNAKFAGLTNSAEALRSALERIKNGISRNGVEVPDTSRSNRAVYLKNWLPSSTFRQAELVRAIAGQESKSIKNFFLTIASDKLRDHSLQEPADLRIRRRRSPLPKIDFSEDFLRTAEAVVERISAAQAAFGLKNAELHTAQIRNTELKATFGEVKFDAAVTSPPYAMALPYIDTQRLSLVWLGLVEPSEILQLEATLIGSRELRGRARPLLEEKIRINHDKLPDSEWQRCCQLQAAIGPSDGFRRRAVPILLYRYFSSMQNSFRAVAAAMKRGGHYALVVGHNHTTLGGSRFDIDTPRHLANIANAVGWRVARVEPLETYQRYGLHVKNAVREEALIVLENG